MDRAAAGTRVPVGYTDRLIHLNLPTVKYRRLRGDVIEVFMCSAL